jgi:hypothetical protein
MPRSTYFRTIPDRVKMTMCKSAKYTKMPRSTYFLRIPNKDMTRKKTAQNDHDMKHIFSINPEQIKDDNEQKRKICTPKCRAAIISQKYQTK